MLSNIDKGYYFGKLILKLNKMVNNVTCHQNDVYVCATRGHTNGSCHYFDLLAIHIDE